MKRSLYLFLVFIISPFSINAQIVGDCNTPFNNASALTSILLNGLSYSNATLNVQNCSAGSFNGEYSNIGINEGVVLATGGVESISPGEFSGGVGYGNTDEDLSEQLQMIGMGGYNLNNTIVLEFDFIPDTNFISFQYVFASNEYTTYTCSQFNDIFGLFLSGPGIYGPFTNNGINLALVPDSNNSGEFTNTPVGINTINSGTSSSGDSEACDIIDENWQDYSIFFTDNINAETVNFPGFTVPLTATSAVISGETYHIKIAIADVMDGALNSAVFLEGMVNHDILETCNDQTACNYTENESCVYTGETEFINYVEDYFNLNQVEVEFEGGEYQVFVQGTDVIVDGSNLFSQGTSLYLQGSNLFTQGTSLFFYGVSDIWNLIADEIYSILWAYDTPNAFDCNGCVNDVDANNICDEFQVGCPWPEFIEYNPLALIFDVSFCETLIVYGCINPTASNFNTEANVSDSSCEFNDTTCLDAIFGEPLYLPDGSGVTYSTSLTIECFAENQTLIDVNDILSININMEHSYAGDLDMFITAPNGVQVQLYAQAGGATWFGEATDQDATDTNPGIGYDYGWSMNPTYNGTMADGMINNTTPDPSVEFSNILNPDIYLPLESFDALLGTPLNGDWTITIVDNLGIDNGWIFSWGISFFDSGISEIGCTDPSALNYNPNASEDDNSCEYETCPLPDYWTGINTGLNQTIMIPGGIQINGENIPDGSQLGVFYMDDFGTYQSAGSIEYNGDVIAIPVMADDATTPETDGLINGDVLVWGMWDADLCEDMILFATYSSGPEVFTANGISFVESFNLTTCQTINFTEGWFLFSTFIASDITDMEELFTPIIESIVIVKNNEGLTYLPEWNYNGIGNIANDQGYQVKTYYNVSLDVCGTQVSPESNPLNLLSGWNLISYLREEPANVVSVVASLVESNNLVIFKNYEGLAYLPEWDYNGIGDMFPTQGYQLKINQAAVLEYLPNSETYE